MFAVKWEIEKFSYELKGRKIHLITDHRALENIRSKPKFENHRLNRWIESIQEYDFTIKYKKGEDLIIADALSRLYEEEKRKEVFSKKDSGHGNKIKNGKW